VREAYAKVVVYQGDEVPVRTYGTVIRRGGLARLA
jgi:hypothetical protein